MKIRNGFVSNSSSSSFVILATKETHNKAVEQLNDYAKAVVNDLVEEQEVFGQTMYFVGDLNVQGNSYGIDESYQPEGWEVDSEKRLAEEAKEDGECDFYPGESIWQYKGLVQKQPANTWFYWSGGE